MSQAPEIARGVCRLLAQMGCGSLTEFTIATGRRFDVMGLGRDGKLLGVEIKSSVADFRADQKWPEYLDFCDALYFAVAPGFPTKILPGECGLIVADAFDGVLLRPAPETRLNAARRKAVTLRFALVAAARLRGVTDPPL
ncbi:MmcB family DNA repair protein [Telmatospirillum sp. J64-1]|uniref:MmcB family DNA repair protein n=1 Tax=Telmatospirillum sp. J64-1 TaxID=2502183 RepID=UPI002101FC5A|nr:MmcB family DNA repair protein [Telmatospirillum sp. J64-1]